MTLKELHILDRTFTITPDIVNMFTVTSYDREKANRHMKRIIRKDCSMINGEIVYTKNTNFIHKFNQPLVYVVPKDQGFKQQHLIVFNEDIDKLPKEVYQLLTYQSIYLIKNSIFNLPKCNMVQKIMGYVDKSLYESDKYVLSKIGEEYMKVALYYLSKVDRKNKKSYIKRYNKLFSKG